MKYSRYFWYAKVLLLAFVLAGCGGSSGGGSPSLTTYQVTPSFAPAEGGSMVPATVQSVAQGQSASFTITPAADYGIASVSGCGGTLVGNVFVTAPISGACTVSASFSKTAFAVTATAVGSGAIACDSSSAVAGSAVNCSITPGSGYKLLSLTDNALDVMNTVKGNTYTIQPVNQRHDVVATFGQVSYAVTTSVGLNGYITPTSVTVPHAQTASFVITPPLDHNIASITGCNGTLSGTTYTTGSITGDCSISVSFLPNQYNITTKVPGGNGTATCLTPVTSGSTSICTFTPSTGYQVSSITDNGVQMAGNSFAITNVRADHSIEAVFDLKKFVVTPTLSPNGTLVPSAPQQVPYGDVARFSVMPATGFSLASMTGCGGTLSGSTFTTGQITGDCSVSASFSQLQYNLTSRVVAGSGTVVCSPTQVGHGSGATCTITPAAGFRLSLLTDNTNDVTPSVVNNTYSLSSVTNNHDVAATFAPVQFTVSAPSVTNGTVIPVRQVVDYGGRAQLTITPATGYVATATGCGGTLLGSVYSTGLIASDCSVQATFTPVSHVVTPVSGANGSIFPAVPQSVRHAETATFVLTPSPGYSISSVSGCGGTLSGTSYTTGPVTGDCSVTASFSSNSYTVTPVPVVNGTITPSTPQVVVQNGTASFTITPDNGYRINSVTGCGGSMTAANKYTTGPITGACNIVAGFVANTAASVNFTLSNVPTVVALQFSYVLPVGVVPASLKDTADPDLKDIDATALTQPAGASSIIIGNYRVSTRTVEVGIINVSGFGAGRVATLISKIVPGSPTPVFPNQATVIDAVDTSFNSVPSAVVSTDSTVSKRAVRNIRR